MPTTTDRESHLVYQESRRFWKVVQGLHTGVLTTAHSHTQETTHDTHISTKISHSSGDKISRKAQLARRVSETPIFSEYQLQPNDIITDETLDRLIDASNTREVVTETWHQLVGPYARAVCEQDKVITGVSLTAMQKILKHREAFCDGVVLQDLPRGFCLVKQNIMHKNPTNLFDPLESDQFQATSRTGETCVLHYDAERVTLSPSPIMEHMFHDDESVVVGDTAIDESILGGYTPSEQNWFEALKRNMHPSQEVMLLCHAFEAFRRGLKSLGSLRGCSLALPKSPPILPQEINPAVTLGRIMVMLKSAADPAEQLRYLNALDLSAAGAILAPPYMRIAAMQYIPPKQRAPIVPGQRACAIDYRAAATPELLFSQLACTQDTIFLAQHFYRYVGQQAYALPISTYHHFCSDIFEKFKHHTDLIHELLIIIAVYTTGPSFSLNLEPQGLYQEIKDFIQHIYESVALKRVADDKNADPNHPGQFVDIFKTLRLAKLWNHQANGQNRPPTLPEYLSLCRYAYRLVKYQYRVSPDKRCGFDWIKVDNLDFNSRKTHPEIGIMSLLTDVLFETGQDVGFSIIRILSQKNEVSTVTKSLSGFQTYYFQGHYLFDDASVLRTASVYFDTKCVQQQDADVLQADEKHEVLRFIALGVFNDIKSVNDTRGIQELVELMKKVPQQVRRHLYQVLSQFRAASTFPTLNKLRSLLVKLSKPVGHAVNLFDVERIVTQTFPGIRFDLSDLSLSYGVAKQEVHKIAEAIRTLLVKDSVDSDIMAPLNSLFDYEKLAQSEDRPDYLCMEVWRPMIEVIDAMIFPVAGSSQSICNRVEQSLLDNLLKMLPCLIRLSFIHAIQELDCTPESRVSLFQAMNTSICEVISGASLGYEETARQYMVCHDKRDILEAFWKISVGRGTSDDALIAFYIAHSRLFETPALYAQAMRACDTSKNPLSIERCLEIVAGRKAFENDAKDLALLVQYLDRVDVFTEQQAAVLLTCWMSVDDHERDIFAQVFTNIDVNIILRPDYQVLFDAVLLLVKSAPREIENITLLSDLFALDSPDLSVISHFVALLRSMLQFEAILGAVLAQLLSIKTPAQRKAIIQVMEHACFYRLHASECDLDMLEILQILLWRLIDLSEDILEQLADIYAVLPAPAASVLLDYFSDGQFQLSSFEKKVDLDPCGGRTSDTWEADHYGVASLIRVVEETRDLEIGIQLDADFRTALYHDCLIVNHLGQQYALHQQSRKALSDGAKALIENYKQANGVDRHALLLCVLAYSREVMFRSTGLFPDAAQLYTTLLGQHIEQHLVLEIGTGQGKSVSCALLALFEHIHGRMAINLTTNEELASRDMLQFSPFFSAMLDLSTRHIQSNSPACSMSRAQTHYATQSGYSLYRAAENYAGRYVQSKGSAQSMRTQAVALLVDEADDPLLDNRTANNYALLLAANAEDAFVNPYEWLYQYIRQFAQNTNFKDATNPGSRRSDIQALYRYLRTLCGLTQREAELLDALSDDKLDELLDAYLKSEHLKRDQHYFVIRNQQRMIRNEVQAYSDIVIVVDDFPQPGTSWRWGVTNFIKLRENEADRLADLANGVTEARKDPFRIDPDHIVTNSECPRDVIRSVTDLQENNRVICLSATPGSSGEIAYIREQYGINATLAIPPQQPSRRKEHPFRFSRDLKAPKHLDTQLSNHQLLICDTLAAAYQEHDGDPVLLFLKDIQQVEDYFLCLTGVNVSPGSADLLPLKHSVQQAYPALRNVKVQLVDAKQADQISTVTHRGGRANVLTIATGIFKRGIDIRPEGDLALICIGTQPMTYRQACQAVGRTGRREAARGNFFWLFDEAQFGEALSYDEQVAAVQAQIGQLASEAENKRRYNHLVGDISQCAYQQANNVMAYLHGCGVDSAQMNKLITLKQDMIARIDSAWEVELSKMAPDKPLYSRRTLEGTVDNTHLDRAIAQFRDSVCKAYQHFHEQVIEASQNNHWGDVPISDLASFQQQLESHQVYQQTASDDKQLPTSALTALDNDINVAMQRVAQHMPGTVSGDIASIDASGLSCYRLLDRFDAIATDGNLKVKAKKLALSEAIQNQPMEQLSFQALCRLYQAIYDNTPPFQYDRGKLNTIYLTMRRERHRLIRFKKYGNTSTWQGLLETVQTSMISCKGDPRVDQGVLKNILRQPHGRINLPYRTAMMKRYDRHQPSADTVEHAF